MKIIVLSVLLVFSFFVRGQVSDHFYADDSLEINADFYQADPFSPYIIFMHQAGSSRGEYKEIAPRFTKMKFNGLALDL